MIDQDDSISESQHSSLGVIDETAQDWFLLLTSGEPNDLDRDRFAAWYEADPRHRAAYDELTELWTGIDDLRDAFAPPGHSKTSYRRRNRSANNTGSQQPLPPRRAFNTRRKRWRPLRIAMAVACLALLVVAIPHLTMTLRADYRTGVGEQARIDLPDGSIAWLNTDSAIAVDYSAANRQIRLLHGEAQFDVAKKPDRPFAVLANQGRSVALGTVYAVREDDDGAVVTVTEGKVEVSAPVGNGNRNGNAMLHAGQQVQYGAGVWPERIRHVDANAALAWRQGFVVIKNQPLSAALAEIDRYRTGRILLLADESRLEPVSARLAIETLDDGLAALAATQGLTMTRVTEYLVLLR